MSGWVAGAVVVGSLITADATSGAAEESRDTTLQVSREAEALNKERYAEAQELLSPYIESSGTARDQIMVEMGLAPGQAGTAYMRTPGYQSMMEETQRGVEQAAATGGNLYSGRRMQAAGEAGAGVQSQFYNNYMNLLTNMASPSTATNLASMGVGQGATIGQQNLAAQQAASGYNIGAAQSQQAMFGDLVGAGAQIYGGYMAGQPPATPPPSTPPTTWV